MLCIKILKNKKSFKMKEKIDYQEGQVVSKTLVQNELLSTTLFAFEKGEEISTHALGGDALVTVLERVRKFIVDGKEYILNE